LRGFAVVDSIPCSKQRFGQQRITGKKKLGLTRIPLVKKGIRFSAAEMCVSQWNET
jgi:hypothetical protein